MFRILFPLAGRFPLLQATSPSFPLSQLLAETRFFAQFDVSGLLTQPSWGPPPWRHVSTPQRCFLRRNATIVSFPLAQTGEGISECELLQWFVKVGMMDRRAFSEAHEHCKRLRVHRVLGSSVHCEVPYRQALEDILLQGAFYRHRCFTRIPGLPPFSPNQVICAPLHTGGRTCGGVWSPV